MLTKVQLVLLNSKGAGRAPQSYRPSPSRAVRTSACNARYSFGCSCRRRPRASPRSTPLPVGARMRPRTLRSFLRLEQRLQWRADTGLRAKLPPMIGRFVLALVFAASMANASPLDPGQVEVLDGDTIRIVGETFRLVGLDPPETYRARCPPERELGNRATFRLRQIVAAGGLDLERVACACRSGTEGTPGCNYGRSCGVLKARGQDVGAVLVTEGLAHAF